MTPRPRKRPKKGAVAGEGKAPTKPPPKQGPRAVVFNAVLSHERSSLDDPKDSRTSEQRGTVHELSRFEFLRIFTNPADPIDYIDVRLESDGLHVMRSSGGLAILPQVANHIVIETVSRF